MNDLLKINYFAVSLPDLAIWDDDLQKRNKIHCCYVMGLGHAGLGAKEEAERWFEEVRKMDGNKKVLSQK